MPGARPARSLTPHLSLTIVLQCLVCMLQSVVLLLSCLHNHWAGCCVFAGAVITRSVKGWLSQEGRGRLL